MTHRDDVNDGLVGLVTGAVGGLTAVFSAALINRKFWDGFTSLHLAEKMPVDVNQYQMAAIAAALVGAVTGIALMLNNKKFPGAFVGILAFAGAVAAAANIDLTGMGISVADLNAINPLSHMGEPYEPSADQVTEATALAVESGLDNLAEGIKRVGEEISRQLTP